MHELTDETIFFNLFSAAMGISMTSRKGLRVIGDAEQALDTVLMGRRSTLCPRVLAQRKLPLCSFFLRADRGLL